MTQNVILTLNAGSSTLKFALFEVASGHSLNRLYSGLVEHGSMPATLRLNSFQGEEVYFSELKKTTAVTDQVLDCLNEILPEVHIIAISHRLVHGGQQFFDATQIDEEILKKLKALIPLAPLHLPAEVKAIESLLKRLPDTLQMACFDTAFHRDQLELSKWLPLPRHFYDEGMIRYGFHGLSYEYIATQLTVKNGLTVVAHLGSGASVCALKNLKSVTHSMGFSTNEGLMMSKRSGSIDPGVILYLLEEKKYSIAEVHSILFDQSGLLGVSGESADIRQLESKNTDEAKQAIDFFCYRAAAEIGKLLPALGGLNTLVFTAGIGENSALIRQKICGYFQWLGLKIDNELNNRNCKKISSDKSKVTVLVIPTDEEQMLAMKSLEFI